MIANYKHKYKSRNKFIYEPNAECNRRANDLLNWAERIDLPAYFFHYQAGGHVAALHRHTRNKFFFRIDLKNFFYSIGRNRISRLLRQCGYDKARDYAEWSTVKNPYAEGPKYVLPIGFKQSPLLASLALWRSAVASAIEEAEHRGVFVSVYFDDLVGSANDEAELRLTYEGIMAACVQANLVINQTKLVAPAREIVAFNCRLTHGHASVTDERIKKFKSEARGPIAEASFIAYCKRVTRRNRLNSKRSVTGRLGKTSPSIAGGGISALPWLSVVFGEISRRWHAFVRKLLASRLVRHSRDGPLQMR
jgi:hypothetical protein